MSLQTTKIVQIVALAVLSFLFLFFFMGNVGNAQQNEAILSWQANNFYPSNYQGKAMATDGTGVTVSLAITNSNGQVINPSNADLRWYLDSRLVNSGVGLTNININTRGSSGEHQIRVEGVLNGQPINGGVTIPKRSPSLAIESRYPYNTSWGEPLVFRSIPYFFNVSSLSDINFSWQINNRSTEVDMNRIMINQEDIDRNNVLITANARNIQRNFERSSRSIRINIIE